MKAVLNDTVLAEASTEDLVKIEGNWYFPPSSIRDELTPTSPTQYRCSWKGDAQYFNAALPDGERADVAWSYPDPLAGAADRVGKDFSGYVAFDRSIEITE
ncbi:DUF427 domain-containing protein [Demequina muriae]|uniref:DUF427 domain-containing protein n=1 Tax=Demequina muriae TaxID=3051664 RepID=A0ABT8GII0_9MICO|nr:DUF427 domain-containing protein [Demequina sp. EGI L300058]MDN4481247.1 DUF427 domain-containing protein [Demequina sp. EGI L300058]